MYGAAQTQMLPCSDFEWANTQDIQLLSAALEAKYRTRGSDDAYTNSYIETAFGANCGFFVECDLEYPHEIHDQHDDYPCIPCKRIVTEKDVSPLQREQLAGDCDDGGRSQSKLKDERLVSF